MSERGYGPIKLFLWTLKFEFQIILSVMKDRSLKKKIYHLKVIEATLNLMGCTKASGKLF